MSLHRVTLVLDVDDELLVDHVAENEGNVPPYTSLVSEWDASDIFRAEGMIARGMANEKKRRGRRG